MFVTRFPTLSWLQYSMLLRRNFLSAFPTAPWGTVPRGTAPWETVDWSEMLDPTSRYDMLTHPHAILIGNIHPDWQRRLFCGVVNIGETMRKVHVRVDVHLNTSWLWTCPPKFGRILRILSAGAYSAWPKKPSQRVAVPNPPPFHHGGGEGTAIRRLPKSFWSMQNPWKPNDPKFLGLIWIDKLTPTFRNSSHLELYLRIWNMQFSGRSLFTLMMT